jgi:hypothetical protein
MMPRIFVDSLSDMLFNRFNVKKVNLKIQINYFF